MTTFFERPKKVAKKAATRKAIGAKRCVERSRQGAPISSTGIANTFQHEATHLETKSVGALVIKNPFRNAEGILVSIET